MLQIGKHRSIIRILSLLLAVVLLLTCFVGCKKNKKQTPKNDEPNQNQIHRDPIEEEKEEENTNDNSNHTDENKIIPTICYEFYGGVAGVFYTDNGVSYYGIINTNGDIIFSINEMVKLTPIGNGATIVYKYDNKTSCLVNANGEIVKIFDGEVQLLAHGDGLALLYQFKDNIDSYEHLYGVINASGEWVYPMTDLEYYPQEGWDYNHYYMGDGIFAIMVKSWAGTGGDDFIFLNSYTGSKLYISRLRHQLCNFVNGVTFVYDSQEWSDIAGPYYGKDTGEGIEAPAYYILQNNGTFKEYNMEGKDFRGYSNGYLYYTLDGNKETLYVENIISDYTFTYTNYSASSVHSIQFDGDYGLVALKGNSGNLYFTVIDKNGNQQFDPIETTSYNSFSGTHSVKFSDETIIFKNTDDKVCIANKEGLVIATEYLGIQGAFEDNLALASFNNNGVTGFLYINPNNEVVIDAIYKK